MTKLWHVGRLLLLGLAYLSLAAVAAVAMVSLLRGGSEAGYLGQFLIAYAGGPILIVLLCGGAYCIWRWRRKSDRVALIAALVTLAGALSAIVTLSGYFTAAQHAGVRLDYARMLWPWASASSKVEPVSYTYDRFDNEAIKLRVYRDRKHTAAKAPVLVYIHGGGWVQGSPDMRHDDMQAFAQQGYVVVGLEYALSSKTRHLWDVTEPQLGCALSWIAANAERIGADVHRIAIFGESAGGNLVLNLGSKVENGLLARRCAGELPDIAAVISIYPPVDGAALYQHPPARQFADAYIGGAPSKFPDRYAAVSPMTEVSLPSPPVLVITGLDDSLVPVNDTLRYVSLARAAGRDIALITIPRAGHAFDANPGSPGRQLITGAIGKFLQEKGVAP